MTTPESIRQSLLKISNESGSDFLALSENFPVLIEEIDTRKSDAATHDKTREFSHIKNELSQTIAEQKQLLKDNKSFLNSIRGNNDRLLQTFSEKMHLLDAIHDIILDIKNGSEEMEVISLNAMVVSIKSGREGQAFSYITSNLKSMSLRLIKQSDELIGHGDNVQAALEELRKQVQQGSDIGNATEDVGTLTNDRMLQAIESISGKLNSILDEAHKVTQPILKAMEGIQMQDIIRQSLDDVLMAMTKIKEPAFKADPEQKLEQYTANAKLSLLAERCLSKIKAKLDESINVFETNRDEANVLLNQIDESRMSVMYAVTGDRSDLEELDVSMRESIEHFNTFSDVIQSYQGVQTNVFDAVQNIQETVHYMYICFNAFLPIISNLQYVAIAQRIEVARNEAISSIKDTVEHMANLIGRSKDQIETAQKQLEEFTEVCNSQVRDFMSSVDTDHMKFSKLSHHKNNFAEKLYSLKDELNNSIENFNVFSPTFFEVYDSIGERLEHLKDLSKRLEQARNDVHEICDHNKTCQYDIMTQYNLQETEIHNADMEEFLKKFTITENKLEAGNIEGIEVTGGAAAGDITFF